MIAIEETAAWSKVCSKVSRHSNPFNVELWAAIEATRDALAGAKIEYAIIGGVAYGAHIEIRATKDLDIIVLAKDIGDTIMALYNYGFRTEGGGPIAGSKAMSVHHFLGPDPLMVKVDVISSGQEFFKLTLKHSGRDINTGIWIAPVESLIVLKKIAYMDRISSSDPYRKTKGERDKVDYKDFILRGKPDMGLLRRFSALSNLENEIGSDVVKVLKGEDID